MVYVELLMTSTEKNSDRSLFVEVENTKSTKVPIECRVPERSILGLLFYLINVNDTGHSGEG